MAPLRETPLFILHVAAGLLVLALLGMHMTVMHLPVLVGLYNPAGGHPIDWANVVARARDVSFLVSYPLLLWAALFHGLYGLRVLVLELHPPAALARALGPLLVVAGLALGTLGTWAAWASFARAGALP